MDGASDSLQREGSAFDYSKIPFSSFKGVLSGLKLWLRSHWAYLVSNIVTSLSRRRIVGDRPVTSIQTGRSKSLPEVAPSV